LEDPFAKGSSKKGDELLGARTLVGERRCPGDLLEESSVGSAVRTMWRCPRVRTLVGEGWRPGGTFLKKGVPQTPSKDFGKARTMCERVGMILEYVFKVTP
jgi:hypothetical protein